MFPLLSDLDGIDVTGLIWHPGFTLARGLRRHRAKAGNPAPAETFKILSRLVASATRPDRRFRFTARLATAMRFASLQFQSMIGNKIPVDRFDGAEFGDFLWQNLFAMTLPPADFERCRIARYATLSPPWSALNATAFVPWPRRYAKIDTAGYDVLLSQTPWPGMVDPGTQLVVRYHDSIPVFLPHTLKRPRSDQFFHMSALQANAKTGTFACVSDYSRTKLLQIFPELERRSFTVYNCIAPGYFPVSPPPEAVADIITSRIDRSTEPKFGTAEQRRAFYDTNVPPGFRFILMVSALEPRKNHFGLLAAWEALRSKSKVPLALVLVGSPGWGNRDLLSAMREWQQRGELFHLSAVQLSEMSVLYSSADVVVCPSVSEGFDLPAIEALSCGAAVAASDIPIHREMLGDAAAYFDPYSAAGMCETLMRTLSKDLQHELRSKAVQQAARFDKSGIRRQWENVFEYCRAKREQFNAGA